ncbi:MAG: CDC48 family AAA ATPase [Candidatus Thermoplasmatota archaeon]|nr:CDC48 family AAA ATPase [Candidatus Thermoplasmatota archaeon]
MPVTLRVAEAKHRDAGRGIARIDTEIMKKLGLVSGDIIELKGKSLAYAIVWPGYPEDADRELIRIDGNIRSNAGISIDERVEVKKTEAREAKKLGIAPAQPVRIVRGEEFLRKVLEGQPVVKGQQLRVDVLGTPLTFIVTSTQPSGVTLVTSETEIALSEKPIEALRTYVTYEDIGGLKREVGLIREMVELPLKHPELFQKLGVEPPKGVLLHGPPGTGKTLIAKAVANETDANFLIISGPEIIGKYYGESEARLREIFEEAENNPPSIVLIDELDSIAPKRSEMTGERMVERRVVAQLLALMDGLKTKGKIVVIGATNQPDLLDSALRRGGRFDREIEIGIPDRNGRLEILQIHTRGMPLGENVDLDKIADITHGFVGADLAALCKESAMHALRKILPKINIEEEIPPEILEALEITMDDFYGALKGVTPSAMREVFIEAPKVKWKDVGGLDQAKQELIEAVEWPLKYPEVFETFKTKPPKGILLYGPPGTGKTLLAKAVATESEANFISIKGPELLSKFVGESERGVREMFRKARQAAPCIIFFDEIDSMAPSRTVSFDSHVSERVVSQLLTELDGLEELKDVVVLCASNRPDMIDKALLRPGRIDRLIYIPPPGKEERKKILEIHLEGKPLAKDVDLDELAEKTSNYVGADIEAICREAVMLSLREVVKPGMDRKELKKILKDKKVELRHFDQAIKKVKPTMTPAVLRHYEEIMKEFAEYVEEERPKEKEEWRV